MLAHSFDLSEVIDAAVAIGLSMMQTNIVQPDTATILKVANGVDLTTFMPFDADTQEGHWSTSARSRS